MTLEQEVAAARRLLLLVVGRKIDDTGAVSVEEDARINELSLLELTRYVVSAHAGLLLGSSQLATDFNNFALAVHEALDGNDSADVTLGKLRELCATK